MPAITQNPNPNNNLGTVVSNGAGPSASIWQYPNSPAQSILNFQTVPSQPLPGGTSAATGLLTPPALIQSQLVNFSPAVFDLSPDSALLHFMQALLGDSGVGQLRKRQLMARLQEQITGTQFYDLDSFYGALFGAIRGPSGSLPVNPSTGLTVNPYADLASPDGWDDINAADAAFRERIIQLARAINLGGTVAGLRAQAEALSGVKCHIYETWRIIDRQGPQTGVISAGSSTSYTRQVTWSQMQAQYATWAAIPFDTSWNWLSGYTTVIVVPGTTSSYTPPLGGLGVNCRAEVVVMPRKKYGSDLASQRRWGADQYGIESVLEVLKPASVLLSVTQEAQEVLTTIPIAAAYADSEFWEVTYTVTPSAPVSPCYSVAQNSYQRGGLPPGSSWSVPRPPDCGGQGSNISYAGEVTASWAHGTWTAPGIVATPSQYSDGQVVDQHDYEIENLAGQQVSYLPQLAVMDPVRAASARTSGSQGVKSAPYSGPRIPVSTHG
jgi:hypothetical protein